MKMVTPIVVIGMLVSACGGSSTPEVQADDLDGGPDYEGAVQTDVPESLDRWETALDSQPEAEIDTCTGDACRCGEMNLKACCGNAVCWFNICGEHGDKVVDCPYGCKDARCEACSAQCQGKVCGDDGCGTDCGYCAAGRCDGLKWTAAGTCQEGTCKAGQVQDCNDGDPCSTDTCEPNAGCSHQTVQDGTTCLAGRCQGIVWNIPMTCLGGQCAGGGGSQQCLDGNVCTDDVCSPSLGCSYPPNTKPCDDTDPCTAGDTCQMGACLGTGTLDCDDKNECTADSCLQGQGCTHSNTNEGQPCDVGACAGLAWITAGTCTAGTCVAGSTVTCDDSTACTTDSCVPATGCSNTLQAGYCLIAGACYANGTKNPANACEACTSTTSTSSWTVVTDGTTCIPGYCSSLTWTKPMTCVSGQCSGGGGTQSCSDGHACTTDSCTATSCRNDLVAGYCQIDGACHANGQVNPLNPCQICTTSKSTTTWSNGTDGVQCQAASCADPILSLPKKCASGQCVGTTQSCDDGLVCTTDSCNSATGCANVFRAGYCLFNGTCYTDGQVHPLRTCYVCKAPTTSYTWELVPGTCSIADVCYEAGQANPSTPCQVCAPATSTWKWSNLPYGTQCLAGACSFQAYTTPKTCNGGGYCNMGGTTVLCVSTACSVATCDESTGCEQAVESGFCLIDGGCYTEGQTNPLNSCQTCSVVRSTTSWTAVTNGINCGTNQVCYQGSCCTRQCAGKTCGADQCGATCGTCAFPDSCIAGSCVCVPQCTGKVCGEDGCGGTCGTCASTETCDSGKCMTSCGLEHRTDKNLTDPSTGMTWWWSTFSGTWSAAKTYCSSKSPAGFWRLPSINELRTLVRGCSATMPGGLCPATNSCGPDEATCWDAICTGCSYGHGPCSCYAGSNGCYADGALVASVTRVWSSTAVPGDSTRAWTMDYGQAGIFRAAVSDNVSFTCVR